MTIHTPPAPEPAQTDGDGSVSRPRKEGLIVGLIPLAAVALATTAALSLTASHAGTQADDAAEQYVSAVHTHLEALLEAGDEQQRAAVSEFSPTSTACARRA